MDLWYDVDTALAEVPVNILPLISSSDFVTIQGAVAYDAAGMALYWHFCTTAGAYTLTAVTPTTGGNYDWTDQGAAGIYTIEIPASGGASINNDTEGFGWFTGSATGILPWRGPVCGFRAAALNNSLIDAGTTGLLAPTTAARTLDVTATGGAGIDWSNVEAPTTTLALTGTTIAVTQKVDVETIKTNAVVNGGTITFPSNATLASTAGAVGSVTGAVGSVTGNVGGNVTGSVGSVVGAVGSVTGAVASVTGNVGGNVTGSVGSVVGAVGSVTGNVGGNVVGSVASVTARVTANTDQLAGQTVTAAAGVTFPTSVASPTNVTAGVITTVTNLTNAPTNGDLTAAMKTSVQVASAAAITAAEPIDANVAKINNVTVNGDGSGTSWGP